MLTVTPRLRRGAFRPWQSARPIMLCPGNDTIAALACGRLDPTAAGVVEEHLADCGTCRRVMAALAHGSLPGELALGSTMRLRPRATPASLDTTLPVAPDAATDLVAPPTIDRGF